MNLEIRRVWTDPVLAEYPQVERFGYSVTPESPAGRSTEFVELASIEDLVELVRAIGTDVIVGIDSHDGSVSLEIYDDHRE